MPDIIFWCGCEINEPIWINLTMTDFRDNGIVNIPSLPNGYFTMTGTESSLWRYRNTSRIYFYSVNEDSTYGVLNFYRYRINISSILNPGYNLMGYNDSNLFYWMYCFNQPLLYEIVLLSVTDANDTDPLNTPASVALSLAPIRMDGWSEVELATYDSTTHNMYTNIVYSSAYNYTADAENITIGNETYSWVSYQNVTSYLNTTNDYWTLYQQIRSWLEVPLTSMQLNIFGLIWLLITFLPAIILNLFLPRIGFVAGISIMTILLGLTQGNYFFVTVIALICVAFIIMRGDG